MTDRSDPLAELERFIDRLNEATADLEAPFARSPAPAVDIADAGDAFEVRADLPGIDREDLDLRLSGRTLRIHAEHESEETERDETHVRRERYRESFDRAVELTEPIDESGVEASLSKGVLTVTLPKAVPEDESLEIDIE